jgi:hypothetical protein
MVYDRCVFPVNATLEAEYNLDQLSYISLPIHTSANAAKARRRVDFDGYNPNIILIIQVSKLWYP